MPFRNWERIIIKFWAFFSLQHTFQIPGSFSRKWIRDLRKAAAEKITREHNEREQRKTKWWPYNAHSWRGAANKSIRKFCTELHNRRILINRKHVFLPRLVHVAYNAGLVLRKPRSFYVAEVKFIWKPKLAMLFQCNTCWKFQRVTEPLVINVSGCYCSGGSIFVLRLHPLPPPPLHIWRSGYATVLDKMLDWKPNVPCIKWNGYFHGSFIYSKILEKWIKWRKV